MSESTRVGYAGAVEIHLKKKLEITSEITNQVNQLPSDEDWYVIMRNPNSEKWMNAQPFSNFKDADERFVKICGRNGLGNAVRCSVASSKGDGDSREVKS